MACGVPVVGTKVGGVPEQVVDGETGRLVPPSDPRALGAAIVEMLEDPVSRCAMGANARRRAEQLWSLEKFVDAYERLFTGMAQSRAR